jgi:FkbM family methyltransferase
MAAVGRRYPLYSGNFQIVNSRYGQLLFAEHAEQVWCPSPGGPLLVPLNDAVGRCVFYTGDYDKKLTWLCRKALREGDVALDIGANLGLVTLTMASCVGENGRVHAFEPNPLLQRMIEQSVKRSSFGNVTLYKFGLGSKAGELELRVPTDNAGQGTFMYHENNSDLPHYRCAIERLSDVVTREKISKIRLIKIDVEGFENEVLLGAEEVLARMRPDIIVFESNEQRQPVFKERAPVKTLRRLDYSFFAIPKALLSMSIEPVDPDLDNDPGHDIIAVPSEKRVHVHQEIMS